MAEELGIRADDEAEEAKVERLEYLRKVRLLFLQGAGPGGVDDGGLLLYLLACLKAEMLLDLDLDVVKQLDAVLSAELPKAKGWKRLSAQVAALARHPDVSCYVYVVLGRPMYLNTYSPNKTKTHNRPAPSPRPSSRPTNPNTSSRAWAGGRCCPSPPRRRSGRRRAPRRRRRRRCMRRCMTS